MADEPDPVRDFSMGPSSMGAKVNLNFDSAQKAVNDMAASIKSLEESLKAFGNNAYNIAATINRHLGSIGDTATKVAQQLGGVSSALGNVGGGGSGGGGGGTPSSPSGMSPAAGGGASSGWVSSAAAAIGRVVNAPLLGSGNGGGGGLPGGLSLGTFIGSSGTDKESFWKDVALAPVRYLRSRINTNRDTALMASGGLNMQALQQGASTAGMMTTLSQFPGSIYGSPTDLLSLFGSAPALGASFNFNNPGQINRSYDGQGRGAGQRGQGVRASGFFEGIRQMQQMNPMAPVSDLVDTLGSYSGNTGAQQRAMMYTGGAMGMIAVGGRQKSLSEWAESILKWFEGLRPGAQRGKPFDYGTLMAQYFPGSNFDAWFNVNQVPQNMRDYFWTYALGKASRTGTTGGAAIELKPEDNNVAYQRLRSSSELTRTEFSLAGQMAPQYAQRESSNRWFNALMGSIQRTLIPAVTGKGGALQFMQFLPDALEDLLMTGLERGATELFNGDVPNAGDIGDSGGYGSLGGTGVAGLHPDLKSKVGAMLRANPKLKVNSGLRDIGLQGKLRDKGYTNVSGKSSAHTRGMAADLGPKSQHGWIARNAKRFGLASGAGHGEPWHVGMQGDIPGAGDIGDPFDIFNDFVKGAKKNIATTPAGMADFVGRILNALLGTAGALMGPGGTEAPGGTISSSPDALFDALYGATKDFGLKPTKWSKLFDNGSGSGSDPDVTAGNATPINSGPGINTAVQAARLAGFTKEALVKIVAIAGRESGFNPGAHRTSRLGSHTDVDTHDDWTLPGDRGMWQINYVNDKGLKDAGIINNANDLINPIKNAKAAWKLSSGGTNFSAWGIDPSTGKPSSHGDPLYKTDVGAARAAVEAAGFGDIESSFLPQSMPAGIKQTAVVFHNTFQINGGGVGGYGGGSNGGIDVKRTVTLLADQLESEMKKRLARAA